MACLYAFAKPRTALASAVNTWIRLLWLCPRDAATAAASICCCVRYSVPVPKILLLPESLANPPPKSAMNLIKFATPFAIKPNIISAAGATTPAMAVKATMNCFVPSPKLLKALNSFVPNSISGVTALINSAPIGARDALSCSICFCSLKAGDSSTLFSSRSAIMASSSVLFAVSPRTLLAWLPSLTILENIVDILANWNLPNNVSIALALSRGSSSSSAYPSCVMVPLRFPTLPSTMPTISIPNADSFCLAASVGLIILPSDDLIALAAWLALMPPSRMAVSINARSSTSPPSCCTTEPAFGMASLKSSMARMVWFSAAFRNAILPAKSSAAIPKALVSEMVVSRASSCSRPPRTASLVACVTCSVRSVPTLPIWATLAARPTVFSTAIPYLVNSSASSLMFANAFSVSASVVNMSP